MEIKRGIYWPSSYLHQGSLHISNTQEWDQVSIGRRTARQGKVSGGPLDLAVMCSTASHGSGYATVPALLKPPWSQMIHWDGWPLRADLYTIPLQLCRAGIGKQILPKLNFQCRQSPQSESLRGCSISHAWLKRPWALGYRDEDHI